MVRPEADVHAVRCPTVGLLRVAAAGRKYTAPARPRAPRKDPRDLRAQPGHVREPTRAPRARHLRHAGQSPTGRAVDARGGIAGARREALSAHSGPARILYEHSQSPTRSVGDGTRLGLGGRYLIRVGWWDQTQHSMGRRSFI